VGLKWDLLSLVGIIEEIHERKSSSSGIEKRDYWPRGSVVLTMQHPLPAKVGTDFAGKLRSISRYSLFAD
jgi:hypothetical protein